MNINKNSSNDDIIGNNKDVCYHSNVDDIDDDETEGHIVNLSLSSTHKQHDWHSEQKKNIHYRHSYI
jgi:hypothetical protein